MDFNLLGFSVTRSCRCNGERVELAVNCNFEDGDKQAAGRHQRLAPRMLHTPRLLTCPLLEHSRLQ